MSQLAPQSLDRFRDAMNKGDAEAVRRLLLSSADLRAQINDPIGDFGARPVHRASKKPAVMDVLLDFGADINLRTDWNNGPFSVLDSASEEAARYYISRGATLTAHAAARLGWIEELRQLIDVNPDIVYEKGGDGQRPLHFAKTTPIVDLLLERGAEIDARCVDHHSTPAQYALAERPDVCRHLLRRGAAPDIYMAARLGDADLVDHLIDAGPACLEARINAPGYAPVPPFNIYCWSLDWHLSPHEVALKFDQQPTYERLLRRSDPKVRFLVACSRADEHSARQLIADHPRIIASLSPRDHALMPHSLFRNRLDAVRLMLLLGFDPMVRGMDGGTLLHVACWHGQSEIVATLLRDHRNHIDLEAKDPTHDGTPLGWAIHGSKNSWVKPSDHAEVVRQLIDVGAKLPERIGEADEAVRQLLYRHGVPDA